MLQKEPTTQMWNAAKQKIHMLPLSNTTQETVRENSAPTQREPFSYL